MTEPEFDFEAPDRFVVGTVGLPGARAFFLQARHGHRIVSVGLEKVQVAALADGIEQLLREVARRGISPPPPVPAASDRAPLDGPVVEDFRASTLTLTWSGSDVLVEAAESDEEGSGPLLRVRISAEQAREFSARAKAVVAAGRRTCVLCGRPEDHDGGTCARLN